MDYFADANDSQKVLDLKDQYDRTHPVIVEFMRIKPLVGDKWSAKVFVRLREV